MDDSQYSSDIKVIKSEAFADRITALHTYLTEQKHEFVMSNQIYRSGLSIGANIAEAVRAYSRADFFAKLSISLKEAEETAYWLRRLYKGKFIDEAGYKSMAKDCRELIALLVAIIKHRDDDKTENQQNTKEQK